jgi:uncharacterized protein
VKYIKLIVAGIVVAGLAIIGISWFIGGKLIAAQQRTIANAPPDLPVESISIQTTGTQPVRGWWIQGKFDKPAVLLLHGIGGNRLSMVNRARALTRRGYSVLLLDLQGHGESPGEVITLGLRESIGVAAARDWIKERNPSRKIGVIGVSLGGASVLLGKMPCGFDAVVLEAVYSTLHRAIENRIARHFGIMAPFLTPFLEIQVRPRLGIQPSQLNPVDFISQLGAPVLIVAGGHDLHTRLDESKNMYIHAVEPKFIWVLPEAVHEDFFTRNPKEYEDKVIGFLEKYLQG